MPDDVKNEDVYRDDRMQQWKRHVDNLQKPDLLPMRNHRQTEMEQQIPYQKGATILFIGRVKA
eukprot:4837341-Heterocapsa_arctica.AAC.1